MTITSAICNSFKQEILVEGHNFTNGTDTFKISLYSSDSATLNKSTTAYTAPADGTADPTNTYEVTSTSSGYTTCLLYTSPSPRDGLLSRMPSSA